ncbi:MAG: SirB1 family protein [Chloroflexota bacterium]
MNRDEFDAVVRQPEAEIDLAMAALLVAREEYPSLEVGAYLRQLDEMAVEVRDRIGAERHPLTVAAGLSRYLFVELGFRGTEEEYFDPRASYLNDVIDRRRGIPLSLSLVYMEVARRAGFEVLGVGLPGHFIVKHPHPYGETFVDPFSGGAVLSPEECTAKVDQIYNGAVAFQPCMLGAVTKRQILSRGIHNLKTIYVAGRRHARALAMVELLLVLAPWDLDEIRDRGMLRYHLDDLCGAVEDLETYLEYSREAGDVETVRRNVRALRRLMREPIRAED